MCVHVCAIGDLCLCLSCLFLLEPTLLPFMWGHKLYKVPFLWGGGLCMCMNVRYVSFRATVDMNYFYIDASPQNPEKSTAFRGSVHVTIIQQQL